MNRLRQITHGIAFAYYIYIFGWAGLRKIILEKEMVGGMAELGFNTVWTLVVGIFEVMGVAMMIYGIFQPKWKTLGTLFLFPFAVAAFTAHMAHQEYRYFYDALMMCILSPMILFTSEGFRIRLS